MRLSLTAWVLCRLLEALYVLMISRTGGIIQECQDLLANLKHVNLFFVKRYANMTAHYLVRASCSFPDRVFCRSDIPAEVENCILADLST